MCANRLKLNDVDQAAYHCMTRCVNREALLLPKAQEILRKMIWRVADFCGVDVITYAIMPNHFHVLIRVPKQESISDRELLRRYLVLHPETSPYVNARVDVITGWLKNNSPQGVAWRAQQLCLMNDLSAFMKLLKLRFTRWFNATHKRVGTLWAERYKSVLIEYDEHALLTVAAYIDLNAVRKGIVVDPKDYRFCGYADALAGHPAARRGLLAACPFNTWLKAAATYRSILYSAGASPREGKHMISHENFLEIQAAGGTLSYAELLHHRWKFFTDGIALGSHEFIADQRSRLGRSSPPAHVPPHFVDNPSPTVLTPTSLPDFSHEPASQPPAHTTTPWKQWATLRRINRRPSDSY